VVVGVLKADLDGVMVDVADTQVGLDPGQPHGLELQVGHRSGGVLGQGLVDADGDLLPWCPLAFHDMRLDDLLGYTFSHFSPPRFHDFD